MSSTQAIFQSYIQKADEWLKSLMREMDFKQEDYHKAYSMLRAVLLAIRDRLPVNESAHFAAQLPLILRGCYYENWVPARVPIKVKDKDEFLELVLEHADRGNVSWRGDVEEVVRGVIRVINEHIPLSQWEKVEMLMPERLFDFLVSASEGVYGVKEVSGTV